MINETEDGFKTKLHQSMKNRKAVKAKVITDQNFEAEVNPALSYQRDMMEFLNQERIAKEKGEDMIYFCLRQMYLLLLHYYYKDQRFIFSDDEQNFEVRECPNCKTRYVCKKTSTRVYYSALCRKDYINNQIYLKYQLHYDKYCSYMKNNDIEEEIMPIRAFVKKMRKDGKNFWIVDVI